jgi:2-(1,2-epoxy-1,2-dihydrophenyl)acetyl-CoA isomerase
MKYQNILFETQDNIAEIKLNRPQLLNSFNYEMADEFLDALKKCAKNKKIRAIIITGTGRGFCAGQDLEEATRKNGPTIDNIIDHTYNPIIKMITSIEKPIICYVNGIAAGAGANLAISCDITFAASSAKFIQSFVNIGLVPDSGGTYNLPRLIGKQKAAGLMFSGEKISSAEAEKIGMIYKSVDDENGYQITLDFAKKISEKPTKSIGLIKNLLNLSNTNNLSEQLELEKKYQITAANSTDHKEGVKAFFEKRKPKYIGE